MCSVPEKFSLDQNYPNPFNPETTIRYQLPEDSYVTVKVYNILGEEVITLIDTFEPRGFHTIRWNGRNEFDNIVSSGVYWVRMEAGQFVAQRKIIFLQ